MFEHHLATGALGGEDGEKRIKERWREVEGGATDGKGAFGGEAGLSCVGEEVADGIVDVGGEGKRDVKVEALHCPLGGCVGVVGGAAVAAGRGLHVPAVVSGGEDGRGGKISCKGNVEALWVCAEGGRGPRGDRAHERDGVVGAKDKAVDTGANAAKVASSGWGKVDMPVSGQNVLVNVPQDPLQKLRQKVK